ncbi:peroxide stress protein YaaA [Labedella populi]|uniref:Peroxide stress protein YaaA n=1 Tax=Labedella populi TaxID=2498850 RepID=A0A444QGN5_9MICO|nr:peroxide stress protein YaaA [Labedella populi]RWZ68668.1 peroxide stress protein YaaA [Labedella populi]
MLLLLPPSETKVQGGTGRSLLLRGLSFPELTSVRSRVLTGLAELSRDRDAAIRALKLGPQGHGEVAVNRAVRRSATLPAVDRYTGVLYDALDARSLPEQAREAAGRLVVIQSALFGPIGALDPIPAYRLSHSSNLPGVRLAPTWAEPAGRAIESRGGLVVDLRSEGYAALGPIRDTDRSVYIRVVSVDGSGHRRALNHFNKKTKGLFTRAVLESGIDVDSIEDLAAWAGTAGFVLRPGVVAGEWDLVVPDEALASTASRAG